MLVLTGQELVTANFSEWANTHEDWAETKIRSCLLTRF
jgi:hypothetical protein